VQPQGGIQAKVQYDYEKSEDNEIDLREGEYVTDIEMVDKDWWLGVNERGERGLFPGNYVEMEEHVDTAGHEAALEPEPEPEPEVAAAAAPAVGSQGPTATALYDYEAAEDNEISFPEGAKIENVVSVFPLLGVSLLSRCVRNSRTMTGGLGCIMGRRGCSRPTTCSWISEGGVLYMSFLECYLVLSIVVIWSTSPVD
jgi:hypothetical protein